MSHRFLLVGFLSVLLLAVLTLGTAGLELTRIEREALELADESQRATYYLGVIGTELGRMRSHLNAGIRSPRRFLEQAAVISTIETHLNSALDALPEGLGAPARQQWLVLERDIAHLREDYGRAALAIRSGKSSQASTLLDETASVSMKVFDELDQLTETHRARVLARLRSEHRRVSQAILLELGLAGVFFIGMAAIWATMIRVLRRHERLIADYMSRLEAANSDLDAFAGVVAHDLRNALTPIVVGADLLQHAAQNPKQLFTAAERMHRSAHTALTLVDSLLAFSRAACSTDPTEAAALRPAVDGVLEELAPAIARLQVVLDVGEIPEVLVRCSPGLLHILLANVCGNAVKYLEGQPERRVRLLASRDGSMCRLEVEDTGPGIPQDAQARIFEPFFRVPGTRAKGTGIGLATVRRILDARGGRIEVHSSEGSGSRFTLWMPLVPAAAYRAPVSSTNAEPQLHR